MDLGGGRAHRLAQCRPRAQPGEPVVQVGHGGRVQEGRVHRGAELVGHPRGEEEPQAALRRCGRVADAGDPFVAAGRGFDVEADPVQQLRVQQPGEAPGKAPPVWRPTWKPSARASRTACGRPRWSNGSPPEKTIPSSSPVRRTRWASTSSQETAAGPRAGSSPGLWQYPHRQGQPWQKTVVTSRPGQSQVDSRDQPPIRTTSAGTAADGAAEVTPPP